MKRVLLLFILSACIANVFAVDRTINISLEQNDSTIPFINCKFTITKRGTAGSSRLELTIKNTKNSNVIFLFDQSYSQKQLKNLNKTFHDFPQIVYSRKEYKGPKDSCNYVEGLNGIKKLDNGCSATISISINPEGVGRIELPLYEASYNNKKKKKATINDCHVLTLNITVPKEEEDKEYEGFVQRYNNLIEEIKKSSPFCINSKHTDSRQLMNDYQNELKKLANEISPKLMSHSRVEDYQNLSNAINNFKFDTYDCGRHNVATTSTKSVHSCPYCNMSLEDINNAIEEIYLKLIRGKIDKAKALEDARKFYNACNKCDKLIPLWKKGGNVRTKIEKNFDSIKRFKK